MGKVWAEIQILDVRNSKQDAALGEDSGLLEWFLRTFIVRM